MKYYIEKRASINSNLESKFNLKTCYLIYTIRSSLFFEEKIYEKDKRWQGVNGYHLISFKTRKEAEDYIKLLERRDKVNQNATRKWN